MIKESIQQEGITIVNSYAPNIGAPKYIKQILIDRKGEIDSDTIIVRDFNTPLTSMGRSSKQKINKETLALSILDQMNLIDIYRANGSTKKSKRKSKNTLRQMKKPCSKIYGM